MQDLQVKWDSEVYEKFPEIAVCIGVMRGVNVEKENEQIRKLKIITTDEVRVKYKIETLKDDPTVRAYRDFYWKLGIDPTKIRPSGEALLRRVLHEQEIPRISTVVDAYNLASMKTIIPVSGFDKDRLNPPFHIRFAENDELFTGIGMTKSMTLTNKMVVLSDEKQVLCIYPYRDSDYTKITRQTRDVVMTAYGAPGITDQQLKQVVEIIFSYIKLVSSGETEMINVARS